MDLRDWRTRKGHSLAKVAELLTNVEPRLDKPISASVVQRHENGDMMPGREMVDRYVAATAGAVTAYDFTERYYYGARDPAPAAGAEAS